MQRTGLPDGPEHSGVRTLSLPRALGALVLLGPPLRRAACRGQTVDSESIGSMSAAGGTGPSKRADAG